MWIMNAVPAEVSNKHNYTCAQCDTRGCALVTLDDAETRVCEDCLQSAIDLLQDLPPPQAAPIERTYKNLLIHNWERTGNSYVCVHCGDRTEEKYEGSCNA